MPATIVLHLTAEDHDGQTLDLEMAWQSHRDNGDGTVDACATVELTDHLNAASIDLDPVALDSLTSLSLAALIPHLAALLTTADDGIPCRDPRCKQTTQDSAGRHLLHHHEPGWPGLG